VGNGASDPLKTAIDKNAIDKTAIDKTLNSVESSVESSVRGEGEILRAEIITIGDEILRGEIVDSNKALMSERLHDIEVEPRFQTSVLDHPEEMADAFRRAVDRAEVVLVSGGLGPTRDDLTTEVLAETFGLKLVLHAPSLETIQTFFRQLGRDMTENNAKQAYFPDPSEVLPNPVGTAPGFMLDTTGFVGSDALIFAMPGVPSELELMLEQQVLPRVLSHIAQVRGETGGRAMRARLLRTFGLGESTLDAELEQIARSGGVELGFRTSFPDNFLRPVVRSASADEADAKLESVCGEIYDLLGHVVYGEDEETLPTVVGRLLCENGATIATAESCTGGLLAEQISQIAGASQYFMGGVVAYSNQVKMDQLDVPEALLTEHGAVSEPVAVAMAEGVLERFGTDFGVSTTGISGPDGGTDEKPVGLVCVALARRDAETGAVTTHVDHFIFPLDRVRHRTLTVQVALDWVRRSLLGVELVSPSLLRRRGGTAPPSPTASPQAPPPKSSGSGTEGGNA
jgi:nicotinamide-nucleotide amidase